MLQENDLIIEKILKLKKEKNVMILAHNYQNLDIHKIADFIGDSLQLAQEAKKVKADIILFCGVRFMAETAKLLNPHTKVLLSAGDAGCPMADMIEPDALREYKKNHPDHLIVCYVNSSVEIKAESDVCVTSSNAVKITQQLDPDKTIMFVPDQNLGQYVRSQTGRKIEVWDGMCPIHHYIITLQDVERVRREYPDHLILVHPECKPEIVERADKVFSTKGMADFAETHDKLIIGTEFGLTRALQDKFPNKSIVPLNDQAQCKNMKKTTLQEILMTLETERNQIEIDPDIAQKALQSIEKMLELS